MIPKFAVRLLVCCVFYFVLYSVIPIASGTKRVSYLKQYLVGEPRTRNRHNYIEQVASVNELSDNMDDIEKRNLLSFIVDYADIIRDDIILLDNPVESRTEKRGNFKRLLPEPPCICEYNSAIIDLGEDYYPRFVENKNCSQDMCYKSYLCQSRVYDLTVLKRRSLPSQESELDLPRDLSHRWIAEKQPVTIGCVCTNSYSISNRVRN